MVEPKSGDKAFLFKSFVKTTVLENNGRRLFLQVYSVLPAFPGFLASRTSPASQIAQNKKKPILVLMAPA